MPDQIESRNEGRTMVADTASAARANAGPGGIPAPGSLLISGKYRVERVLGIGGMGVVLAARHTALGHEVAIKLLSSEFASRDDQAVNRFLREAQAAATLRNEHVVRVSDVGTLDDGTPYILMEHLAGIDLGLLVTRDGAQPIGRAVDFVLQACEALAEAHARGIVHRDLKPSNLFLVERDDGSTQLKVLDFGISKMSGGPLGAISATLTAPGAIMGSPLYMSPEQVRSSTQVDARTDIWSLAMVLFELLAGHPMFDLPTFSALCAAITADPALPVRAVRADIPEALDAVIGRCLEKDPARRYASVAELAIALEPFAPAESLPAIRRIARVLNYPLDPATFGNTGPTAPRPSFASSARNTSAPATLATSAAHNLATSGTRGTARTVSMKAVAGITVGVALLSALGVYTVSSRGAAPVAGPAGLTPTLTSVALPVDATAAAAQPAASAAVPHDEVPTVTFAPAPPPAPATAITRGPHGRRALAAAIASPSTATGVVAPSAASIAPPPSAAPPAPAASAHPATGDDDVLGTRKLARRIGAKAPVAGRPLRRRRASHP